MAIYFRVRDHREVPASEALDARGILRHGYGQRVPAHLRDGARFGDARQLWDSGGLVVTDFDSTGSSGSRPGWRVLDTADGQAEKARAYADYTRDLENAWRDGATAGAYPFSPSSEGSPCTVNGRPGSLVKQGGVPVCKPLGTDARTLDARDCPDCDGDGVDDNGDDCATCQGSGLLPDDGNGGNGKRPQLDPASDRRTVSIDAMSANHRAKMQILYDAHARELSEAWRKG